MAACVHAVLLVLLFVALTYGKAVKPVKPVKPDPSCKLVCPAIRNTVCGSDHNTYANLCELSNARCDNPRLRKVRQGKCRPKKTGTTKGSPKV